MQCIKEVYYRHQNSEKLIIFGSLPAHFLNVFTFLTLMGRPPQNGTRSFRNGAVPGRSFARAQPEFILEPFQLERGTNFFWKNENDKNEERAHAKNRGRSWSFHVARARHGNDCLENKNDLVPGRSVYLLKII